MTRTLSTLVSRLTGPALMETGVIPWGSPVPSFGDLNRSAVATLGLNPSNREFVDIQGNELDGTYRRFHTLRSLGLKSWAGVEAEHLNNIYEMCSAYFFINPYDSWFKKLNYLISGRGYSYYDSFSPACHLDLIPYATEHKWSELNARQRERLLVVAGDTLGLLLRDSPVRVLILNGHSVISNFETLSEVRLDRSQKPNWALPRNSVEDVMGFAYTGTINRVAGIKLRREICVLGFNHNIQSSFGVTKAVCSAIRDWITRATNGIPLEA